MINCAKLKAEHCRAVPTKVMMAPSMTVLLLPSLLPRYMVDKHPIAAPRLRDDTDVPWINELWLLTAPVVVAVSILGKRV